MQRENCSQTQVKRHEEPKVVVVDLLHTLNRVSPSTLHSLGHLPPSVCVSYGVVWRLWPCAAAMVISPTTITSAQISWVLVFIWQRTHVGDGHRHLAAKLHAAGTMLKSRCEPVHLMTSQTAFSWTPLDEKYQHTDPNTTRATTPTTSSAAE
jgi:hypothetical protein